MTYLVFSAAAARNRTLRRRRGASLAALSLPALLGFLGIALAILGATVPATAQGLFGDGDAQRREAATALRIDQLEGTIRNLNGQIEQLGFQLRQMQDQMVKMQKDMDFRLQELENTPQPGKRPPKKTELVPGVDQGGPTAPAVGTAQTQPGGITPGRVATVTPSDAATVLGDDDVVPPANIGPPTGPRQGPGGPQVLGTPPRVLGQLNGADDPLGGGAMDGPIDLGRPPSPRDTQSRPPVAVAPVPGVAPKYATVQPTPSARDEYDSAYGYIMSGEYDLAERSFKTFLANHPTDRRAGSAQYWLGESFFQRNMHREATDAFLRSYTQYPDDVKAPDSLLKLGLAYQGLGERKAACNAYDELLTKYPKASRTLRERASNEKTRGKCG